MISFDIIVEHCTVWDSGDENVVQKSGTKLVGGGLALWYGANQLKTHGDGVATTMTCTIYCNGGA